MMKTKEMMIGAVKAAAWAILTLSTARAAEAPKSWADQVTFKGDLRYRLENITEDGKDDRYRERIRARLNAEVKIDDVSRAGIGMSTGQADPVSGNQSLGDGLSKKEFRLDLAYLERQLVPDQLTFVGGRMKNPFIRTQDLIWDSDLNMDGLALKGVTRLGDRLEMLANAGSIWLQERATEADSMLYGGQAGARLSLGENASLMVGGSVYQYTHMEGMGVLDWEKKNNAYGNSTVSVPMDAFTTNKVYKIDFTDVEGFTELEIFIHGVPVSIHGSYVVNTEADVNDTGYLVGLSVGKAKNAGDYMVGWNYRDLEKDAVVGAFTDSDSAGGGTDIRGHRIYAAYAINSNWGLAVSYFMNDKKVSSDAVDYTRLMIDVSLKF